MFPALGRIVGETPHALCARQRKFGRAGLLDSIASRGPGSGVAGTPESVAMFLICMLTNAGLAENVPCAKSIAKAAGRKKCPLTGAKMFKDAFARVLSDDALAARVKEICVKMEGGHAHILYDGSSRNAVSDSSKRSVKVIREAENSVCVGPAPKKGQLLTVDIVIGADTIRALAKVVGEMTAKIKRNAKT
jgi:hypothetical protein